MVDAIQLQSLWLTSYLHSNFDNVLTTETLFFLRTSGTERVNVAVDRKKIRISSVLNLVVFRENFTIQ